ncbi:hypothetical protein ARMGADRAFT_1077798 [Armillaria gallica]|uniref:F-box domain-containing protein n=1 Tax=Armillaria gallica TaxID=47427 RepID=A0A2H3E5U6_ARMGA|nr:hypothetical protein ARMGADRAFT_1077798 [Armillaria gallica]
MSCQCVLPTRTSMHLLDLPYELLSYIIHFSDLDTLRALCLTEKHIIHHIARPFLWRNITVIFDIHQNPRPNLFSLDSGRLAAIRSLSIIFPEYFDLHSPSFAPVFAQMINVNYIRVSSGSGPFIRVILENTMASLLTLELDRCNADPQDFTDMVPVTLRDLCISRCHPNLRFLLGPLNVEELEVHGPSLNGECMPIGVTLRRLTDTHLGRMQRLCLVDTCRDAGCRDVLHLAHALERHFLSLEELILDLPLSQDTHQKLLRLIPSFPVLKKSYIVSRANETSLGNFLSLLPYQKSD